MKVAFCSSEVFPFAKTGGLADVCAALPLALAKKGCTVKVFMPFYKGIKPKKVINNYGYTKEKNVEFYFIKNDKFFKRENLYGTSKGDYPDNLERFSFYSREVLSLLKKIGFSPDIIHSNDWQTSLISTYLKVDYQNDPFFKKTKCVLTIHNLAYQGIFDKAKWPFLNIAQDYFTMDYLEYYGKINLLKAGVVFSDVITTVSPTYANQIQTQDHGCGLEGILRKRKDNLCGILNAIDYKIWDPCSDKLIYKKYSSKTIEEKALNKKKLQKDLGLVVDKDKLLLGMVGRLAEQKGIDLVCASLSNILKKHQVVILGLGDEGYHKRLKKIQAKHRKIFSLNLKFDEKLAHRIYAACDCFLMPSKFEPCGLSQLISYKYATVPIVHHSGGLADTVLDVEKGGGGFVFYNYDKKELINAIARAQEVFKDKTTWKKLIKRITHYNFSWDKAASSYMEVYKKCQSLQ